MTYTQSAGRSVSCPTSRQLHRFYEPLVLLHTLGTARGEHTNKDVPSFEDSDSFPLSELKRKFLNELCFVCDYEKGGNTVTAIGLEDTPQGYVFWVAANECPTRRIVPFLEDLLRKLKSTKGERDAVVIEDVLSVSTSFARSRIETYGKKLLSALLRLKEFPAFRDISISNEITSWSNKVGRLMDEDPRYLVEFAYDQRHSTFVHKLRELACEQRYKTSEDGLRAICMSTRHIIGRLGLHCRSANALVHYTPRMMDLLEFSCVQAVPTPTEGMGRPPSRNKTTPEGVLSRMFSTDASDLEKYRQALKDLDEPFQLSKRFREIYDDPKFKTRVHAEVQVLDHFYEHDREFAEGDRYIACSKPACFCCHLYFRYHPGRFVEPYSHQKVYLNWQPPGLSKESKTERKTQLPKLLDQMGQEIRRDALHQIINKVPLRVYHPDSATSISLSIMTSSEVDSGSTAIDGEPAANDIANNSSNDSSFNSSYSTAASSSAVQPSLDSDTDTDQEDGGILLFKEDAFLYRDNTLCFNTLSPPPPPPPPPPSVFFVN